MTDAETIKALEAELEETRRFAYQALAQLAKHQSPDVAMVWHMDLAKIETRYLATGPRFVDGVVGMVKL